MKFIFYNMHRAKKVNVVVWGRDWETLDPESPKDAMNPVVPLMTRVVVIWLS